MTTRYFFQSGCTLCLAVATIQVEKKIPSTNFASRNEVKAHESGLCHAMLSIETSTPGSAFQPNRFGIDS